MKKKILIIRNTPYDANPSNYNLQEVGIGKAFCRLGYDYDYICFKKENQKEWTYYEHNSCKARYIEKPRTRFMRWGINTSILNKDFLSQYDIIISREYYQIMTYLLAKRVKNVHMYSGPYYNLFMFKWFSPIYDRLFTKSIDKNIRCKFVKSVLAKDFMEQKGYHNVINVGVGLDFERFEKETEIKPETLHIMDFMKKHRCILYVGALSDRKNYPFLLKVYQKIIEKEPDIKFVMIGRSKIGPFSKLFGKKDGDYAKVYDKQLPSYVQKGILHIEKIENPQLKYIYPLAKAFLLPSKLEIFGMVLLEAMYFGAPVISSRNGGSMTLLKNGTGRIIEDFDVDKWAAAVLFYLYNPKQVQEMINKAHHMIVEHYNWDTIARKMLMHINGLPENSIKLCENCT